MDSQRLDFRYGAFRLLLSVIGLGPAFTGMEVSADTFVVRFSWGFSARIPLSSITSAAEDDALVGGIGVHGFGGKWLVNGAASGLVAIDIDPPARGRVVGFPVKLSRLRVSAEDPGKLVALLASH